MIVAYANNRVIGNKGKIPWYLPDDLAYFKHITEEHTVVMGRTTFESIGHPLSNRRNVVLTKREGYQAAGVEVLHRADDVLALPGQVFIIGGESVYRQFFAYAERLYVTEVALDIDGDAFFPEWDDNTFTLVAFREGRGEPFHTFAIYSRVG